MKLNYINIWVVAWGILIIGIIAMLAVYDAAHVTVNNQSEEIFPPTVPSEPHNQSKIPPQQYITQCWGVCPSDVEQKIKDNNGSQWKHLPDGKYVLIDGIWYKEVLEMEKTARMGTPVDSWSLQYYYINGTKRTK